MMAFNKCTSLSFQKEQAAKLEEFEMTKQKRSKKEEDKSVEEKTTLHGKLREVYGTNLTDSEILYMYTERQRQTDR